MYTKGKISAMDDKLRTEIKALLEGKNRRKEQKKLSILNEPRRRKSLVQI